MTRPLITFHVFSFPFFFFPFLSLSLSSSAACVRLRTTTKSSTSPLRMAITMQSKGGSRATARVKRQGRRGAVHAAGKTRAEVSRKLSAPESRPSRAEKTRVYAVADGDGTEATAAAAVRTASPAQTTASFVERNGAVIDDTVFNISQVSFGTIGSISGVVFLVYGFCAYFDVVPGGPVSSIILTYGFPITILGFALKYAELKPVTCTTFAKASALRDRQATSILRQVKDDVTRFRYGDEQHLDLAMERIFRIGRGGGVPRRQCPVLTGVREEVAEANGNYALVLDFNAKKLGLEGFLTYQEKFQTFFGPGITCEMKASVTTETNVDVWLISEGDGVGGQTDEDTEILPPLMPGLPARRQPKAKSGE